MVCSNWEVQVIQIHPTSLHPVMKSIIGTDNMQGIMQKLYSESIIITRVQFLNHNGFLFVHTCTLLLPPGMPEGGSGAATAASRKPASSSSSPRYSSPNASSSGGGE